MTAPELISALEAVELVLEHRSGTTHVYLHPSGDHIVTRYVSDAVSIMLPCDSPIWQKAVARAMIGAAFL